MGMKKYLAVLLIYYLFITFNMIFSRIARCFQSQGKNEEAVVYFESLLSKNPSYVPGLIEISMTYSKILQESLDLFQDRKAAIYFKKLIHTASL